MLLASFKWTYAVLSPFGGWIADRTNKRFVIAGSLFLWSAITWWTGHATTYSELLTARALMGISEAFYIPTALALIADYHPGQTRARAVGLHQAGIYTGQILGGFAGYVADSPGHGWRWAFSLCGVAGILYALPLLALIRDPNHPSEPTQSATPAAAGAFRGLLGSRNFILLLLAFTLPAIAGWVVRDWMPEILREKFHLGQGQSGVSAILYVQLASICGVLAGGTLSDRWMRTSPRGHVFTSAIGMLCFLPALFAVSTASHLGAAIAGLLLFGLGWGLFDCNNMPILCQVARREWRATGYGLMNLVSISCGGFGDWAFGALRDRDVPLPIIFGAFAGIALVSVFVVLRIRPSAPASES
jgi:MFS family permease